MRVVDSVLWFLVLFVGAIVVAQFVVGIKLSTVGSELSSLDRQWATLVSDNQKIREEIALGTSLSQVASKARELGIGEPQSVLYLTPGQNQALSPSDSRSH